jgi:hypothetical protein
MTTADQPADHLWARRARAQLSEHADCDIVCRFVLTHTVELPGNERFSAEIQF